LADGVFALRVAAIIVRRPTSDPADSRLLVATNDTTDLLYSVGGAVAFGETVREALAREIREETGADLPIGQLAAVEQAFFRGHDRQNWHQVTFCYWVDVSADFEPVCGSTGRNGEPERLRWIGAADLTDDVGLFPALLRETLAGRWRGVRQYVERNGKYEDAD